MKVFDCITYFNEPLLFDLRLNILDKHVDKFIVSEALYTHSGKKKSINFKKDDYPKFKNRIEHVVIENEPTNLFEINESNKSDNSLFRLNAAKRIEKQRNEIIKSFSKDNNEDWLVYSDSDEIPNLEKIDLKKSKKKNNFVQTKCFVL